MKIVVTGATGFKGEAVVRACINDPRISKIVVLSRTDIAEDLSKNSKVQVILHDDFLTYPASLTDRLKGAEARIWCVGPKRRTFLILRGLAESAWTTH